jgi:hypothetical protein
METILEEMLDSVLVIPFQKDLTSRLASLSESYAEGIDRHGVEDCVSAFLCGETNTSLRSYIIEQYFEQFSEDIKLPPVVYQILSQYVVYILIIDEEYDDTDRMIYSLIVRNMMVICRNSYNKLLASAFLPILYPFSDSCRETKNCIQECSEKYLTPDIFECDNFEEMEVTLDENYFSEIKQLAQQAARLEYIELIASIRSKEIEDPFILAYYASYTLAITPQWKYVDSNPVKTLINILPAKRKSLKVKNFKDKLRDSEWYTNYDAISKSSLLIKYIENTNVAEEISELQLSDLEFAIYMYYEFCLEKLIKD